MKWWLIPWLVLIAAVRPGYGQLPEGEVHGYVYVEGFELRKEFAIRLRAFPEWTAGAPLDGVLDKSHQARILFQTAKTLASSCPLEVDGAPLPLELDAVRFVQLDPEAGVKLDEREQIPVREAQIAAAFGGALRTLPNEVLIHWNLFPKQPSKILLSFVSGAGKASAYPTPENPTQKWLVPKEKDAGVLLPLPRVEVNPPRASLQIPFFTLLFGGIAVALGVVGRLVHGSPKILSATASTLFLLLAVAAWGVAGFPLRKADPDYRPVSGETGDILVHALLRNIYSSFDYRDESQIYDTLAHSVSGNLLERIYLDVRKGLELEERGGPRAKINHIDLRSCLIETTEESDALRADAEWVAVGDVTHWGHIHTRLNKYRAWLTIAPVESTWKVTEIEIVDEGRM